MAENFTETYKEKKNTNKENQEMEWIVIYLPHISRADENWICCYQHYPCS